MSQTTTEYEPESRAIQKYLNRVRGLKSEGTYKVRRADLKDFEQWCDEQGHDDVLSLGALNIEDFIIHLRQEGYAANTINRRFHSLQQFYRYMDEKYDLIDESPFEDIDRKEFHQHMTGNEKSKATRKEISYVTPEEVEKLAENVPNPRLRNELAVKLMFQTGVRRGELVTIRLDDIDRDERSINIRAEKTHENRTVYYQPSLDMLLQQWIDGGYRDSYSPARESPYLFVTHQSEKLNPRWFNRMIKKAATNAEIQETIYQDARDGKRYRVTSHALRHGHAVESLKSGIDVRTVQKHLGHAELDMTMKYLRLIDDDVRESYQQFGSR